MTLVGRAQGFTLIEIAIVLVVIGLLLSGGLLAIAPVLQSSRVTETEGKLDRVQEALILHAILNGCLPCPATGATSSEVATAGQAVDDAAYATGCADNSCASVQGVVPWQNLGLSEAGGTDGFGYRVSYGITAALTLAGGIDRVGTSYPTGTITVTNTVPVNLTAAAAYVLVSHGDDNSLAFGSTGVQTIDPNGSANQAENSDADGTFIQDDFINISGGNHFDDIVRWRTAPMIVQLCGAGACGNPG